MSAPHCQPNGRGHRMWGQGGDSRPLQVHGVFPGRFCHDFDLFSSRASTSAGIELMRNEILVLGNSVAWDSNFVIGHAVMEDALDTAAVDRALTMADTALGYAAGTTQTDHLA